MYGRNKTAGASARAWAQYCANVGGVPYANLISHRDAQEACDGGLCYLETVDGVTRYRSNLPAKQPITLGAS
jgi:hypothetical protein